jgi:hypothetical protein
MWLTDTWLADTWAKYILPTDIWPTDISPTYMWLSVIWLRDTWLYLAGRHFATTLLGQGILKGEKSLYCWPPVWLVWNQLYDYWQFLFLCAKQTNSNLSNRRSTVQWYFPFNIPWLGKHCNSHLACRYHYVCVDELSFGQMFFDQKTLSLRKKRLLWKVPIRSQYVARPCQPSPANDATTLSITTLSVTTLSITFE